MQNLLLKIKSFGQNLDRFPFLAKLIGPYIPTAWLVISERFVIREHISLLQVNTLACYK